MSLNISWLWRSREPAKSPPNPQYPDGIDLDVSRGLHAVCSVRLPYPAKGLGVWMVTCTTCGLKIAVTATGRPDDPRSVKVACKRRLH